MSECVNIKMKRWPIQLMLALLFANLSIFAFAQDQNCHFKVNDNTMVVTVPRNISISALSDFTQKFNINDIGLYQLITTGVQDSLRKNGWDIKNKQQQYIITKPIEAANSLINPEDKIIFTAVPTPENWRVVGGNKIIYGANHFKNYQSVRQEDGIVYFYLKGHEDAKRVRLAGNFTNWQYDAFPMTKTDDGWIVKVSLVPGEYYYKFIINNSGWATDPANELRENDGRGNINSVVFVTNRTFSLKGHENAENIYLAGSFNNWDPEDIQMKKVDGGWQADIYLSDGTYQYEFIADGKTIKSNARDASDTSIAEIGRAHAFILKGFTDAKKVCVAGNFNDWKQNQLYMHRTATGWELPYVLGPGNYQYKFIVDGRWMTDPANNQIVDDGLGNQNSFIIIEPNYTFRLRDYSNAKTVFLSGDFNAWSPIGLPMTKTSDGWECNVYLARGKHLYKFIVDGKWIRDPTNKLWEDNKFHTGNSILWIE